MAPWLECIFQKRHLIPCEGFKGKRLLHPGCKVKHGRGSSWQWLSQVTGAFTLLTDELNLSAEAERN